MTSLRSPRGLGFLLISLNFAVVAFTLGEFSSDRRVVSSDSCEIPNQQPKNGECKPIKECPAYQSLRQDAQLTVSTISFMRQINCKTSGEICCPLGADSRYQNPAIAIDTSKVKVRASLPPTKPGLENRFGDSINIGPVNDEECGIFTDQRIIGGEIAGLTDYPWTALLIYNSSFQYGCSGSIITKRYILTAAHCVTGRSVATKGKLIRVRLGEYDTQGNPDCIQENDGYDCADDAKEFEVDKVIVHPYYEEASLNQYHDIALLKTKAEIEYSLYVQPLCIPSKELKAGIVPGKRMALAGWGATDRFQGRLGNVLSPIKLFTEVPVFNQTACQDKFRASRLVLGIGQFCAGGEKDVDSCPGDSGGPLMYFNHDANRFVAAGIVSLGKSEKGKLACGEEGYPGVYTRTDQYVDWIENAMRNN